MRINGDKDIRRFLAEHGNFAECVIEEMTISDYGTTFTVFMGCDWAQRSRRQEDERSAPTFISLSFRLVQELHVTNAMNAAMLTSPESLNWGFNEVSAVQVVEENPIFWRKPH